MKKSLLILSVCAGLLAASCSNVSSSGTGGGDKPLTENIPSVDKTKLSGGTLSRSAVSVQTAAGTSTGATGELGEEIEVNTGSTKEYNLLERLYSTTWYRSEDEWDDGKWEEREEEFVYFNRDSSISKREYENGRPDDADYAQLKHLESFRTPLIDGNENTDANACIVENQERDDDDFDVDFEGYYLVNQDTLYIVDGDSKEEIKAKLARLIQLTNSKEEFQHYDDEYDDIERYVLSTEPRL